VEEFNQFLADEAMAYQGMVVQVLPAQGMALQALPVQGMPPHAIPFQAMAIEAMTHHGGHRFRDFIIPCTDHGDREALVLQVGGLLSHVVVGSSEFENG
jgi:hypothetical protein